MLGQAAARLDVPLTVLDPMPGCPAATTALRHEVGSFTDYDAVIAAGSRADVVTVEIEHVDTAALAELARRGVAVHPSAQTLAVVNDKLAQRRRLAEAGVPGPRFMELSGSQDAEKFDLPAVQKLRYGGYDGRGVALVDRIDHTGVLPLSGPSYLEEKLEVASELAVLVARSGDGRVVTYPPFEMVMDPELHLVSAVKYPAGISSAVALEASRIARAAVEAVGGVGVHAVELFVVDDHSVLVNEIAPRPHNSGHLTIEASETDQFEQHLRAVLGLPLGSTRMRSPAVMRNLVGSGAEGSACYMGTDAVLSTEGAHLHLYGKRTSRAGRKMGHITVCREDLEDAAAAAARAAAAVRVTGDDAGESGGTNG
jgi:5-(carboxyamino)imidazole ribonucleotide synthase